MERSNGELMTGGAVLKTDEGSSVSVSVYLCASEREAWCACMCTCVRVCVSSVCTPPPFFRRANRTIYTIVDKNTSMVWWLLILLWSQQGRVALAMNCGV